MSYLQCHGLRAAVRFFLEEHPEILTVTELAEKSGIGAAGYPSVISRFLAAGISNREIKLFQSSRR